MKLVRFNIFLKNIFLKFLRLSLITGFFLTFSAFSVQALGDPVKISNSTNDVIFPQLTTDSKGYLYLVWQELTPGQAWSGFNPGIYFSRWNGDSWSLPFKISENTGFAEIPSIASDTTDTIHVVWDDETYGSGFSRVAYRTRSPAGVWSSPIETLPVPSGTIVNWNGRVAIGASNVPNAVYVGNTPPASDSIYWSQRISESWTAPTIVSKDESGNDLIDCQWSDLRKDNANNIHLTYWCFAEGVFYRKYDGATWSTPFRVTPLSVEFMRMAVTPLGEVFVTYFIVGDSTVRVRWTQSGVWQTETILTTLGDWSFWGFPIMGVTTDSKERAHVGWGERDPGDGLIDLKYRTFAAGTWGPAQDVDLNNADADTPFIFPDLWDNQHFAWTEYNTTSGIWEIYYRVAEGTIQTVGTGGATVTANPNDIIYVDLSIPSGALSVPTQIGIQIGPVPENVDPTQVTIPRAFTFRPNGLIFNSPSTATIYYNDAEVAGADERQLKPWVWNSQTSTWEAKSGQVNRAQNRIAVSLTGFSLYGIAAPIIKAEDYQVTFVAPETENKTVKQNAYLVQFGLGMTDGSEFLPPELPEDLRLVVFNESEIAVEELFYEPSGIIMDKGKDRYKGVVQFQKNGLEDGIYKLQIYFLNMLVGTRTITLDR